MEIANMLEIITSVTAIVSAASGLQIYAIKTMLEKTLGAQEARVSGLIERVEIELHDLKAIYREIEVELVKDIKRLDERVDVLEVQVARLSAVQ